MQQAYKKTKSLLSSNSESLGQLAEQLLEKEALNYKDIEGDRGDAFQQETPSATTQNCRTCGNSFNYVGSAQTHEMSTCNSSNQHS